MDALLQHVLQRFAGDSREASRAASGRARRALGGLSRQGHPRAFVKNQLETSFQTSKSVKLRSDIAVQWSNPGNEARLDSSFKAIAIDACDIEPLGKYDIRIDVQIPILLSVPQDDVLRQNLKINYWKNDLDIGACVVAVTVFWPIIGAVKVLAGKLRWDAYAWLVVIAPARFFAAIWKANDNDLDPPDATMKKVSDNEFESNQDFSKKKPSKPGRLVLLDYRGLSTGLVLMGRQETVPDTCAALIEAEHCDFEFKPPRIPCSQVIGFSDGDPRRDGELHRSVTRDVYGAADCVVTNVGETGCPALPVKVPLLEWGRRFLDDAAAARLRVQVTEDLYDDGIALRLRCPIPRTTTTRMRSRSGFS